LQIVREHLTQNGRDLEFQVWRGQGERDSSDEEWEEDLWKPNEDRHPELDKQVDTRGMINDAFQQWDELDEGDLVENTMEAAVAEAFNLANEIHDSCLSSDQWDEPCLPDPMQEELSEDGNNTNEEINPKLTLTTWKTLCEDYTTVQNRQHWQPKFF
jgi:hypothetical protein